MAPSPAQQKQIVTAAARQAGIDPAILWGLYGTESGFGANPGTSSAGAVGPFQFEPGTARGMGIDPYNFQQAAYGAARYLAQYKNRGTLGMLSAYNAGPAGALQQGYANKVMQNARSYNGQSVGNYNPTPSNPYGALVTGGTYAGPDQGIDFTGKGQVRALGSGIVTDVDNGSSGWPGGGEVVYKLTSGPNRGRYVYTTESIRSGLKEGSRINQGDVIGSFNSSYPGIESGFAQGPQGGAYGNPQEGKSGNAPDPQAIKYLNFVKSLAGQGGGAGGSAPNLMGLQSLVGTTNAAAPAAPKATPIADMFGKFGQQDATTNPGIAKTWTGLSDLFKAKGQ